MASDPRDTVVALLQLAQSYDSRNIDALMVDSWLDAARRSRWTPDAAAEAIRDHYAEKTDRIMPGHITARIRSAAKAPGYAPEWRPELPASPPASEEGRAAARALFASSARTQEPRKPLTRRRRSVDESDGAEAGPDPVRAFSGDLGSVLRRPRLSSGE
ncbi:hypothetical protein [Nocardia acidivorans]|uniref:hypothetical protein n=1 Tax=Nocardia acidivorans TaxID=404580 RepID=UPI00083053D2|nr:hypothetical protein [Nocardia acidivorans]